MLLDVLLHLITRQIRRIKSSPRRNHLGPNEWLVLFKQIEAGSVDPQVASQFHISAVPARGQRLIQCQAIGIALPPVDTLQVAASLPHLLYEMLLARVKTGSREWHWDAPGTLPPLRDAR